MSKSIAELTGLEILQAMAAGKLPAPSITQTMPMSMAEAAEGYVKFTAHADERHLNPLGGVHGGFAATVLDSVTACAVHTTLEAGVGYSTVDLNVKMVKPVPRNETLVAEGRVLHVSRTIAVSEGSIRNAEGVLLAHATATCVIIRR
ncbi:PaaI family thioesterase [Silvimonas amylolytica]|uniref:Phenylacetic acid degradation protein n=1 Tax=Silvimonas amylolytica TaxID=449663 RepID=A0ABQ2PP63_9NEIS|nr:PaaI family thioesterase [Silvimonas amylolytica]GGP27257.1 phenylacetic acid degradation protein [Silvimonas amylolytica]